MTHGTSDEDARALHSGLPDQAGAAPQQRWGATRRHTGWSRAAAVVSLVHVVLLVALAGFYGLELARGEGSSATNVALSLGLILVFALLLLLLARVWWLGSSRAVVPTMVWNGLLIPVVVALYGADDRLLATGLLLLVVAGLLTAVGASLQSRRGS